MPKSKEQALNIGEILKAYFTMRSRSGYTDNTGDEAHDLLLSRERAEATKKAVASMRIDPSRIDVEKIRLSASGSFERGRPRPLLRQSGAGAMEGAAEASPSRTRRRWQSKRRVPPRRRVLVRRKCQRLP